MPSHLRDTTHRLRPELERGLLPRWLERIERAREHAAIRAEAVVEHGRSRPVSADDQLALLGEDPLERLRGLPAIGRGVPSVMPGTQPERETLRRLSR